MRRQLIVFKVGGGEFAIDILLTKEVVPMREITPVPEAEEYVEGVMNLRGSLVPVLDFRRRLRSGSASLHDERRILIVHHGGRLVGLIVDRASEVVRVDEEKIEPAPDIILESGAEYIGGIVNVGGRFITLINLGKALDEEVACELDRVVDILSRSERELVPESRAVK